MCDAALNLPEKRDYVARGIVTKDLLASGPFGDLIPELIAISTKQLNACCDVLRGDDDPAQLPGVGFDHLAWALTPR